MAGRPRACYTWDMEKEKKKRSLLGTVFLGAIVLAVIVAVGGAALAGITGNPNC